MNNIQDFFNKQQDQRLLSVFYTAGYPSLGDTLPIGKALEKAGVDFLEIGFPYSDPVADGPVIQRSSEVALQNGMTLDVLFDQLKNLRQHISIPVFLMGYFNPVLQYGVERFCEKCNALGIDGVIVPDLPMAEYENLYQEIFLKNNVHMIFLVTPQTSSERIRKIDQLSTAFIYLLSSASTTGQALDTGDQTEQYFKRIQNMHLKNPIVVGFGISDAQKFRLATDYAQGAIVGSAFVKKLGQNSLSGDALAQLDPFIESLRPISSRHDQKS